MSVPGVLVERGFRFFFLAAGSDAVMALAFWLAVLATGLPVPSAFPTPSAWHAHEMLFGFTSAVVAGFLLTAVPNWTGTEPATGKPVAVLAGLWLAGRLALWSGLPAGLSAPVDLAFLPVLAALITPPIVRRRQWRNSAFPLFLVVLWAAQGLAHAGRIEPMRPEMIFAGQRLALAVIVLMIIIIGGRIVPAFTSGWLRDGVRAPPRWIDRSVCSFSAVGLAADLIPVPWSETVAGAAAAVAAVLLAVRMSGWCTAAVLSTPILWVLHLGYGWLVVAFALRAAALLTPWVAPMAALHAFTVGVIGTMTLAVMTRASLGHSGRPLVASRLTVLAYALVTAGGILRVAAPHLPAITDAATWGAGILWIAAYALFVGQFWPVLSRPRLSS